MTLFNLKTFSVPASGKRSKTPCAVHHFVRGQCLRCDEKIQTQKPQHDLDAMKQTVPTTSEGDE